MWGKDRGGDFTLETWTTLSYLAGKTKKIKFGTLVTPIPFRPPGILAKQISTLDLISGGRTILGVGHGLVPDRVRGLQRLGRAEGEGRQDRRGAGAAFSSYGGARPRSTTRDDTTVQREPCWSRSLSRSRTHRCYSAG